MIRLGTEPARRHIKIAYGGRKEAINCGVLHLRWCDGIKIVDVLRRQDPHDDTPTNLDNVVLNSIHLLKNEGLQAQRHINSKTT